MAKPHFPFQGVRRPKFTIRICHIQRSKERTAIPGWGSIYRASSEKVYIGLFLTCVTDGPKRVPMACVWTSVSKGRKDTKQTFETSIGRVSKGLDI